MGTVLKSEHVAIVPFCSPIPQLVGLRLGTEVPELVGLEGGFPVSPPALPPPPHVPGPVWPGVQQVLVRQQRGGWAGGLASLPKQETVVAAAYCSPCQCEPMGYCPSTPGGQAAHCSLSALILTRSTVGTRMVRRGAWGGGFGLQVLGGGVVGQQAPYPSPQAGSCGNLTMEHPMLLQCGGGEGTKNLLCMF